MKKFVWLKVAYCAACESVVKTYGGIVVRYEDAFDCGICECGEEE